MEVTGMYYRQWNLLAHPEGQAIAVDYIDPEGHLYQEPFCFYNLDEALHYGKICIDRAIHLRSLLNQGAT